MAANNELDPIMGSSYFLQKFKLYETESNFYMVGRDKSRIVWRVLKIDRLEATELNIGEDATTYSQIECSDLLKRIDRRKQYSCLRWLNCVLRYSHGGVVLLGFVKFLGPYYMLLITKRKQIGAICGHSVYAVTKSEMIPLPNSTVRSTMPFSNNENRYKKLLSTVDLTKDFYFSYSYNVMRSLQKNLCDGETRKVLYETMFVWNEFLTRGIRNHLKNTLWTVALVFGFFKQARLSLSGRDFNFTLIARRSRHYAGTRYLKRGVNENGRVANDVETEQIVFEDVAEGSPIQISSVVQNRVQYPSSVSKKDQNYEATRLHFENLVKRYGNPIIILNLIKSLFSVTEFANAIEFINKDLPEENRLRFLHWDLSRHSRSKATNVLEVLGRVAANALDLTDFFLCEVKQETSDACDGSPVTHFDDNLESADSSETFTGEENGETQGNPLVKPLRCQKGVLRTNCIDCLDRTNVAQYAYGLVALGHQLHVTGFINVPKIDLDSRLADNVMRFYETMGDTLAHQYGGSAAHNKIFSERRGQWRAATQSQEFFRTLQRYYSNAYMDGEKQAAINVFLGNFQPQQGRPALWELDSNQHYNADSMSTRVVTFTIVFFCLYLNTYFKRSFSENLLSEKNSSSPSTAVKEKKLPGSPLLERTQGSNKRFSGSTPEISTCESEVSYNRHTPSMADRRLFSEMRSNQILDDDSFSCSNFVDLELISSSGTSCEEESYERGYLNPSPSDSGSSIKNTDREDSSSKTVDEFSDRFADWVNCGETLCH
ncbi:hypothetical protein MKW92_008564 [Papaver armeniacum]|nr:hypothetical protein MKW92_008564 [Papaver armeniacum]